MGGTLISRGLESLSLDGAWLFKEFYGEDWNWRNSHMPATRDLRYWRHGTVPGTVQYDLWVAGEVPNPYFERNSLLLEWVPQRTWMYKRTFTVDPRHRGRRIRLCFEGVDYEALFFLNGAPLGAHRGMYTPANFEVGEQLLFGEENLIAVVLQPAPAEQPQVGRTELVRTHKSRMTYWWDFCPRMVHLGIWQPVALDITGPVRIEDLFVRPVLSPALDRADLYISLSLSSTLPTSVGVETAILLEGNPVANSQQITPLTSGASRLECVIPLTRPLLWWPNGAGAQPLYQARVKVLLQAETTSTAGNSVALSDTRAITFGVRRVELMPNETPDLTARPYTFVVNGRKLYLNGWNWVPLDVMYGIPRPEKLERLLRLAARAHVNLLRVWGGGLIETEPFYDLCDRFGIMVWQEFIQSSSGISSTPSTDAGFIAMMEEQAEQIIPRKRSHPSLVLWCGGNELESQDKLPLDDSASVLAALHGVVRRLDPDRLWLPTSASGRMPTNQLETIAKDSLGVHDVHGPWEHQGLTGQFTLYNQGTCLLHSEFGVEGLTNLATLNSVIGPGRQWPVSLDNPYWFHLGHWWLKEPTLRAAFGELPDVEMTVRAAQFLQADGLRYAVEADGRRRFQCSGTLPWQFNEPYPMAACTSAVDYYGRPKPVYFSVAHAYEPLHVSARFAHQAWDGQSSFRAEAWAVNSFSIPLEATLQAGLVGASGRLYHSRATTHSLPANSAAPLLSLEMLLSELEEDIFFLDLRLSSTPDSDLARLLAVPKEIQPAASSPDPATTLGLPASRYLFSRTNSLAPLLALPPTSIKVEKRVAGDIWTLTLRNTGPWTALLLWLQDGRPLDAPGSAYFTVNYFSLFPGETRSLSVEWRLVPLPARAIKIKGWNTPALCLYSDP